MISPMTAAVTLVVALLVFGPKNLPELAKGAGKALGEFKKAVNDPGEPPPAPAAPAAPASIALMPPTETPVGSGKASEPRA